ncbi:membrane glycosyltransferase [Novimethylophilus kurashikiensis]|uniref:Glucans biosynthesis glucosyltransferase H n=1 Tax=Novimethylophilus kurashikiensis TaxID=1825523 RepID=A0A2R5F750_9PROT|nr:glucans biosynthesis glucosyltransferase MdoH [Novimethylophilus kurashikiensis]GBG12511.1 membrane glycosyltransferase [Novimethylophilus kurashikiensis]
MELHSSSRLNRGLVPDICERYLDRLPLSQEARDRMLRRIAACEPADAIEAMAILHQLLAETEIDPANPAATSIDARLRLSYGLGLEETGMPSPRLDRSPMAPANWPPHPFRAWIARLKNQFDLGDRVRNRRAAKPLKPDSPDPRGHWHHVGNVRRFVLLGLILAQTIAATHFMRAVLPYHGHQPAEVVLLSLFAILCAWVSAGFWTAMMGYLVLRFKHDAYAISATSAGSEPITEEARTAIVMPICNEHVQRVFAGLRATYESLAKTPHLDRFDFFVLSDSSDADTRVAENEAWVDLCRNVNGFSRIFYRWRQHRIKRKSGNIADFCRRWGKHYRYMVILDADSVMSGDCLAQLVRLMEANPSAGIIQTSPHAAGRQTLYARLQQFANRVYGPLFVAGLHYWQLGESHYWGHNAIIRVAPFMKHCALGRLPGKGSLSGEILSHDFVEAALMRRAGWAVWIAYDLPGSYEEMPPNLVDELKRDKRWCHGNLINFRLFMAPGLNPVHRAVFVTGAIAYVSAPLWFMFLLISTWLLAQHTLVEPEYFTAPKQLFPVWPEWHPERAIALFGATTTWLFLPKILSIMLARKQGARRFGGVIRMTLSMLWEWVFSMLLAPIRMLFHTQFVAAALTGWKSQWQSPPREDAATTWHEALRRHGWHTLLGLVWTGVVYWLNPSYLWWLMPIIGAFILSVPISVLSSRADIGRVIQRLGFFMIPEESEPPVELRQLGHYMEHKKVPHSFIDAVSDPAINALTCVFSQRRLRRELSKYRLHLVDLAVKHGPRALSTQQRMALLGNAAALSLLHFLVWVSPDAHPQWLRRRHLRPVLVKPSTL